MYSTIIRPAMPAVRRAPPRKPVWALHWRVLSCAGLVAALACTSVAGQTDAPSPVGQIVQVFGQVRVAGVAAKAGQIVQTGQELSTGPDGYLYLQTVDKGFLIVRPNSQLSVPVYRVDANQPSESRFKIVLHKGVARSISGQAVPASRHNFRFNTPVAAIGVIGTDFTVLTDTDSTRVSVRSGGVVVSGFGDSCRPDALGPCSSPGSQQLLASQMGQVLQVNRGAASPQRLQDGALSPDATNPPRGDEPAKISVAPVQGDLAPLNLTKLEEAARASQPGAVLWGRWASAADRPATLDLAQAREQGKLQAIDSHFALLRASNSSGSMPQEASVGFQLRGSDAQVRGPSGVQAASVEDGQLTINFVQREFSTRFDLVLAGGERFALTAQGGVDDQGRFSNGVQLPPSNMVVNGVTATSSATGITQAGYLFRSVLDAQRTATGVTFWSRR